MDTEPTPRSNSSWQEITARANAEAPPEIDVRLAVRRRIESELAQTPVPAANAGILDAIAAYFTGIRSAVTTFAAITVLILLGWRTVPLIHDVAIAVQLESDLLTGL